MASDRDQIVLDFLEEKSSVSVVELSNILNVSDVTVRRLLDNLESEGKLKRTWGGAVSLFGSQKELEHNSKAVKHIREKQVMAVKAYEMIDDEDAIFLDSGSTNMELAKLIVTGGKKGLVVGTNAINIAYELSRSDKIKVFITGGELRRNVMSCVGPFAENSLQRTFYDKGFISTYYCSTEHGLTTPNAYEAQFKRCLMNVCKQNIVMADHSKFGNDSMMQIAELNEIDCIIVDENIDEAILKTIQDMNIEVVVAEMPDENQ